MITQTHNLQFTNEFASFKYHSYMGGIYFEETIKDKFKFNVTILDITDGEDNSKIVYDEDFNNLYQAIRTLKSFISIIIPADWEGEYETEMRGNFTLLFNQ